MPLASLPSPYGIGTMGEEAKKFIDKLEIFSILANVAVLDLAVAEQTDFFAADITEFFIEQSHNYFLLF